MEIDLKELSVHEFYKTFLKKKSMKITFKNTTPGKFICNEYPHYFYTLERKEYSINSSVFNGNNKILSIELDHTEGYFLIMLLFGIEGNMPIVFNKAHKKAKKAILNSIKNGL